MLGPDPIFAKDSPGVCFDCDELLTPQTSHAREMPDKTIVYVCAADCHICQAAMDGES